MPRALSLQMLGPPDAVLGASDSVLPAAAKSRALLAYLVVEGAPVARAELGRLLWPDAPPDRARLSLRGALAHLRRALPERIVVEGDTIAFAPRSGDAVDVHELEALAARHDEPALSRAAELYRGPFGDGMEAIEAPAFQAWLDARRRHFEDLVRASLVRLADLVADDGRSEAAVAALERAAALDPFHEPTVAALLLAMGRAGDLARALARFEALRAGLAEEFGVEPSPELLAIRERLVAARQRGRVVTVPAPQTPFVGRASELVAVLQAIAGAQGGVVTVVGPGGIGKTRLAIQAARRLGGRFLDGVRFVPLAGLGPDTPLAPSLAAALDLQMVGSAPAMAQVQDALRERETLLVLDNFETVAEQAEACGRLAAAGPGVRVLVTSRQPLGLPHEAVVRLTGLGYPSPDDDPPEPARHDAVALFVAAARRVRHDFPAEAELAAIGAICRHVQGYPLALELTAPWVAETDCAAIAARLVSDLGTVPAAGGLPDRHATLQAVFDHSWALLDGADRLAFARLCVFRGGFDTAATEAAVGVTAAQLDALAHRSLVFASADGRYGVHEVLRHFGAARLDQAAEIATRVRDAHAGYYLDRFAAQSGARGPDDRDVVKLVEDDGDNLRAAWRYAVARRRLDFIAPAASDLAGHYYAQGPNDAGIELGDDLEAWLAEAEADDTVTPELAGVAARLVAERGFFALRLGDTAHAESSAERALDIVAVARGAGGGSAGAGDGGAAVNAESEIEGAESTALRLRGIMRRAAGDLDGALVDLEAAEACARRGGADRLEAEAAYHRAGVAVYRGDIPGCIVETRAVLESIEGRGYARLECALHFTLSVLMDRAGDISGGVAASQRCLEAAIHAGYRLGEMNATTAVGLLMYRRNRLGPAVEHLERGIRLALDLGHRATERNARLAIAVALSDLGRSAEAEFHADRSLAQSIVSDSENGVAQSRLRLAYVQRNAQELEAADANARAALAAFEALGDGAGVAMARAEVGRVALRSGDLPLARGALEKAVAALAEFGERVQWLTARLDLVRVWRIEQPGDGNDEGASDYGRRDSVELETALAEATAVRDGAADAGVAGLVLAAEIVRGRLLLVRGDAAEAAIAFGFALAGYAEAGHAHLEVQAAAGLARAHLDAGRFAEAAEVAGAYEDAASRRRLVGIDDPEEVLADLRAALETVGDSAVAGGTPFR